MHFIIGTAGHVDHGKTTLIRALTGVETDRLREEKERGLSIVPGFAHWQLPSSRHAEGRVVGVVDVPGHERFLKNMLTGISGVDIALLVIAADEGLMPQTIEHLHVLELLPMQRGVIVLTKCDLVDAEWKSLARDDIRRQLANVALVQSTLWREAPIVEVASRRGEGLEELQNLVARWCDELESEEASAVDERVSRPFRMAIDRAFSVEGIGTVVTGSVAQGKVKEGDAVEVWSGNEAPLKSRARHLQTHGRAVSMLERGQRGAINVAGLNLEEAARGATLTAPRSLESTRRFDAYFHWLPDAPRPLKNHARLRLHLATTEIGVRIALLAPAGFNSVSSGQPQSTLERGAAAYARFHLEEEMACAAGDRFVLREVGTERVVGGGVVLSAQQLLPRAMAPQFLAARHVALESGDDWLLAECLLRESGLAGVPVARLGREVRRDDKARLVSDLEQRLLLWRVPENARGENGEERASEERASQERGAIVWHREVIEWALCVCVEALRDWHARHPLDAVAPREALQSTFNVFALAQLKEISAVSEGLSPLPAPQSTLKHAPAPPHWDAWLEELARRGDIALEAGGVRAIGHRVRLSVAEAKVRARLDEIVESAAWQLLSIEEIIARVEARDVIPARRLISPALKSGEMVRVGEWVTTPRRLAQGAEVLRAHFATQSTLSVSQARELWGTTRKWALPLLEWYDRAGLTRREGEVRILR